MKIYFINTHAPFKSCDFCPTGIASREITSKIYRHICEACIEELQRCLKGEVDDAGSY